MDSRTVGRTVKREILLRALDSHACLHPSGTRHIISTMKYWLRLIDGSKCKSHWRPIPFSSVSKKARQIPYNSVLYFVFCFSQPKRWTSMNSFSAIPSFVSMTQMPYIRHVYFSFGNALIQSKTKTNQHTISDNGKKNTETLTRTRTHIKG